MVPEFRMKRDEIFCHLGLTLHDEGGYYGKVHQSDWYCPEQHSADQNRLIYNSVYYTLTADSPIGYLHVNKSDILHLYRAGF